MKKDKGKKALALAVSVALIVLDQITKQLIVQELHVTGIDSISVVPGLLELRYLENPAAAFGLFGKVIWLVVALTCVVAVGMVAVLLRYKNHSFFSYTAAALLLAGGLGNLVDRITRGFVVDFIHVMFFNYIFNVADCCVTIGVVCLIIHYIICMKKECKKNEAAAEEEG